jgi:hypothetical protein
MRLPYYKLYPINAHIIAEKNLAAPAITYGLDARWAEKPSYTKEPTAEASPANNTLSRSILLFY